MKPFEAHDLNLRGSLLTSGGSWSTIREVSSTNKGQHDDPPG